MAEIKAIETEYNGYKFRSRLEARWAVFFDSIGMEYVYKPDPVYIGTTPYQLDFYLPESKQYFEVQGMYVNLEEEKVKMLINEGYSVTIGTYEGKFIPCDFWGDDDNGIPSFDFCTGSEGWLCKCTDCQKYWFMGSNGCWPCQCCGSYDGDHHFIVAMSYYNYGSGAGHCDGGDLSLWDFARQYKFSRGYNRKVQRMQNV